MTKREPNFENMKKVLKRKIPDRPVLYEFTMNMPFYERLTGSALPGNAGAHRRSRWLRTGKRKQHSRLCSLRQLYGNGESST